MKIFNAVQSFFDSIGEYVENFSYLFWIFLGAFAVLSVIIIIITANAYECTLTKTIDKINKFLERNPRINDDNLVAFNNLMKGNKVPKVLRRQWQQFMLYREHPASYYMSFKHCVENPMRNSAYRQEMTVYKIISYVLIVLSLVVSVFMARPSMNANFVLQDVVIIPISLLVCYWLISMILDLVHNATTGDLFQNYQYFEINMDKAMVTLPEFVDYEVLFSQEEIKKGIPVLFAYLQKRAVQEQQELEKARLKSVDHEKFDFDEAGLDGSLVLDRAMRETENFSAQRKKYLQEIERVNNEMSALENNYKEQVKDYQRQVQTSKETVENLKSQLEQASSTIEINYIKKQIRDEINRQQLSERDFDITTDKYNQEVKSLKQEIKEYDEETDKAKDALETSMLSEFNTYSIKVYNNLEKIVEEKMAERLAGYKNQIKDLEEQLENRNEELDNVYARYQEVLSQNPVQAPVVEEEPQSKGKKKKKRKEEVALEEQNYSQAQNVEGDYTYYPEADYTQEGYENIDYSQDYAEYPQEYNDEYNQDYQDNMYQDVNYTEDGYNFEQQVDGKYNQNQYNYEMQEQYPAEPAEAQEEYAPLTDLDNVNLEEQSIQDEYVPLTEENNDQTPAEEYVMQEDENNPQITFSDADFDFNFDETTQKDETLDLADEVFAEYARKHNNETSQQVNEDLENVEEVKEEVKEEPKQDLSDDDFDMETVLDVDNIKVDETEEEEQDKSIEEVAELDDELPAPSTIKRKAGRPRKIVDEEDIKPKRKPGRPRKKVEEVQENPKRKAGRPKKNVENADGEVKRSVGRPKKDVSQIEDKPKRRVGIPKKEKTENTNVVKHKVGRPKKGKSNEEKRPVGRPKNKKGPGRPKKETVETVKRGRGRPRKD